MNARFIKNILNNAKEKNLDVIIRTDIARGRGINGISYRDFRLDTKRTSAILIDGQYICIRKLGSTHSFYMSVDNVVAIETWDNNVERYDYKKGGLDNEGI